MTTWAGHPPHKLRKFHFHVRFFFQVHRKSFQFKKCFSADSLKAGLVFLSFSPFRSLEKLKDICNVLSEVKSSRGPKGINSTGNRVHYVFEFQIGHPN